MKKKYEYTVGNFQVSTREAARVIQRILRFNLVDAKAPRITQKIVIERTIR